MKKFYVLMLFALVAAVSAFATDTKTVSYTFTSATWTAWNNSGKTANWTCTGETYGFSDTKGVEIPEYKSATVECPDSYQSVTQIAVTCYGPDDAKSDILCGSFSVYVGDIAVDNTFMINQDEADDPHIETFTFDTPLSGNIKIQVEDPIGGTIYVESVAVTYQLKCIVPKFNVSSGETYTEPVNLVMSTETEAATISYEITGPEQLSGSGETPVSVTLGKTGTYHVKATAKKDGYEDSTPNSVNVKVSLTCPEPTIDIPDGAKLTDATDVVISSSLSGVTVDYRITGPDGFTTIEETGKSVPVIVSNLYLNGNYYIYATAHKDGYNDSTEECVAFSIAKKCSDPLTKTAPGIYTEPLTFEMFSTTEGALIDYKVLDNNDEVIEEKTNCKNYVSITLAKYGEFKVKAMAHKDDYEDSDWFTLDFDMRILSAAPTFSLDEGTYTEAKSVTLATTTTGAKIYYKIGDDTEYTVYTNPIELSKNGTYAITAYTEATESTAKSAEVTKTYTINIPTDYYKLCTNRAWLTPGTKVVFVDKSTSYAMSKEQKTDNRGTAAVTISGDRLTNLASEVAVFTIGEKDGYYTFYTDDSHKTGKTATLSGYLYAASTLPDSKLRTQTDVDNNAEWSISLENDGAASIQAQTDTDITRNYMRFYGSTDPVVNCYAVGKYRAPYIYFLTSTSSVSNVSANEGVKIFGAEGGVVVSTDNATDVAIYTIAGQLVSRTTVAAGTSTVSVAPGFYVVRAGSKAAKVIVK